MKDKLIIIVLAILLLSVGIAFAYYYGTQQAKTPDTPAAYVTGVPQDDEAVLSPTVELAVSEAVPTTTVAESNVPTGWKTYTNETYGFKISYPPEYKALDDSDNLYGWPHAVVLLYKGGQSYDLPIEHWNSQAEYEGKYPDLSNVTVRKVGDRYITLLNANYNTEVDSIIATFMEL